MRAVPLLIDTGPLVAAANSRDPDHEVCADLLRNDPGPFVLTGLVLAETCYLVEAFGGPTAEAELLRSLSSSRYEIEPVTRVDLDRMVELVEQYADLPLGGTDASLIAIAERLGLDSIATLDRRHFTVVRPAHVEAFVLLP